jgi:polyhydroxyalkanoate synthesis regulator phasin
MEANMIDLIKKTMLAGVGAAVVTKDKVEQVLGDFVKEGKVNAGDAKIMADKIAEQGRKEFDELCAKLGSRLRESTGQSDEASQARLAALELRIRILEEKLAPPASRIGEP